LYSCRRDGRGLAQLLRELSALPGLRWLRILYAYPSYFDDELVAEIANNPKVLRGGVIGSSYVSSGHSSSSNRAVGCLVERH
jgi:hypothetical protein